MLDLDLQPDRRGRFVEQGTVERPRQQIKQYKAIQHRY